MSTGVSVTLVGDLSSDSSLGELGRIALRSIRAGGVKTAVHHIRYSFDLGRAVLDQRPHGEAPTDERLRRVRIVTFHLHAYAALPRDVRARLIDGGSLVGYWMPESSRLADASASALLDAAVVWTPSEFSATFLRAHTSAPVHVVPLAVDPAPGELPASIAAALPRDRFVFLFAFSILSGEVRKNPFGLIEAFRRAFGPAREGPSQGRPILAMKVHHGDREPELLAALAGELDAVGGVLLTGSLTRAEMDALIDRADCIASLHRAEGFGLVLAEAMALGKPVIATAYSGNMQFMSAADSLLVRCGVRSLSPDDFHRQPSMAELAWAGCAWAEPDLDHAAELMQRVAEDAALRASVGAAAARRARNDLSFSAIGASMRRLIAQMYSPTVEDR